MQGFAELRSQDDLHAHFLLGASVIFALQRGFPKQAEAMPMMSDLQVRKAALFQCILVSNA